MARRKVRKPLVTAAQMAHAKKMAGSNDSAGMCRGRPPCGGKCCLSPDVKHTLHSCHNVECQHCHGAARFQGKKF